MFQCDPALLPEPNHVMLNHLYALSIKVTDLYSSSLLPNITQVTYAVVLNGMYISIMLTTLQEFYFSSCFYLLSFYSIVNKLILFFPRMV